MPTRTTTAALPLASSLGGNELPHTPYWDYLRRRRSLNPPRFDHYHPWLGFLLRQEQQQPRDTTPPVVTIQQPTPGLVTRLDVTAIGLATDDLSGVKKVEARLDGGAIFSVTFDASGRFQFPVGLPLDGTADGKHAIRVRATDGAGNTSEFTTVRFTLDTRPPRITLALAPGSDTAPKGDGMTTLATVTLVGRTVPGLTVSFPSLGRTTVADSTGHFALPDVPLVVGMNPFTAETSRPGGRVGRAQVTVERCGFPDDLAGWRADEDGGTDPGSGSVTDASGAAVLLEGNSFDVTLAGSFVVPANPTTIAFEYAALAFDTADSGSINDAFEVALVDPNGVSLVPTFTAGRDAFFNATEGQSVVTGSGVTIAGQRATLDISQIIPGTTATLVFRLVNNDQDTTTSVRIACATFPAGSVLVPLTTTTRIATPAVGAIAPAVVGATVSTVGTSGPDSTASISVAAAAGPPTQTPSGDSLLDPDGRVTFTTSADFDLGTYFNTNSTAIPDELQLQPRGEAQTFPFIWVSNSDEGTVSRFDTRTGKEIGRYRTGPSGGAHSPSRTAVASDGSVWVANRAFGIQASAIHVLLEGFIDRNGNGVLDTSRDLNADGFIQANEMLPWDANNDGKPDDERIAVSISVGRNRSTLAPQSDGVARAIAIDANDDVWVGLFNFRQYEVYDHNTGALKAIVPVTGQPYGAVVDADGFLWGATRSSFFDRVDTKTLQATTVSHGGGDNYGITLDNKGVVWTATYGSRQLIRYDPATDRLDSYGIPGNGRGVGAAADGTIWVATNNPDRLVRYNFAADGRTLLGTVAVPVGSVASAAVIDADGFVWTTTYGDNKAWKIDPATNTVAPGWPIATGRTPYNYSDMTGQVRLTVTQRTGTWTEVLDGERDGAAWAGVDLTALVPNLTSTRIRVRAANNRADLSNLPWVETPSGDVLPKLVGRYLQVEIGMTAGNTEETPHVEDVTIVAVPPPSVAVDRADGSEEQAGSTIVLTGQALAQTPLVSPGNRVLNAIVLVTVNGVPVEALDPAGRFFTRITVAPGQNDLNIVATDRFGQTVATMVGLVGIDRPARVVDFTNLSDITASFDVVYARTSFAERTEVLYADTAVRNIGRYPVDAPLYVSVTNISDPTVRVLDAAGVTPEGVPYYDFTGLVTGGRLAPNNQTGTLSLAFLNPNRRQFTYDLVFFGLLNRAPSFTTIPTIEAHVGRAYAYDAEATDADHDPLTFSLVSGPTGLRIDAASGELTWDPATTDLGTHSVVIRVDDSRGGYAEQHYTLTVTEPPPNRPPLFTSVPAVSANVNAPYTYQAAAADPDGDPITFALTTSPAGLAIDSRTGLVTWVPTAQQVGFQSVTLTATDGHGGTATQAYSILVGMEPGNHPPVIVSDPVMTGYMGHPYTYDVDAIDPDGDPLEYNLVEGPSGMTVDTASGEVRWNPSINQAGQFPVVVAVTDGRGGVDTKRFTIQVIQSSNAKIQGSVWDDKDGNQVRTSDEIGLADQILYLDQNQNGRRDTSDRFTTTDADGNYSFSNLAPDAYIVREELKPDWVQTAPSGGFHQVTINTGQVVSGVDFGNRESAAQSNRAPDITSTASTTAAAGQLFRYDARAIDPDFDTLTFELVVKPEGMTVHPTLGSVVWFPTAEQVGTHDVTLRVQDGRGGFDTQSFTITVSRPNTNPAITSRPRGPAIVGVLYQYQVAAQDADGDTLAFRLDEGPDGMVIDPVTGLLTWTPAANQVASHHVAISVADGRGGGTTQLFDLPAVATAPNDPPTITSQPRGSVRVGTTYRYDVAASDPNNDALTYSLPTAPTGMTIDATGHIIWVPTIDQLGGQSVQVRVDDGRGAAVTQTFTLQVLNQVTNQPPNILSTPPQSATAGVLYAYDPRGQDPDNDPLAWALETAPAGMSIDSATGAVRWTPAADQVGTQRVVVRAFDPLGGFATQTFDIAVRAVNLPPSIASAAVTTASVGEAYIYAVRANDVENDPLTFVLTTAPPGMTIDPTTGVIQWTPAAGQVGSHDVALRVADNQGGAATQNYTVVVSAATPNRSPVITSSPAFVATAGQAYTYQAAANDPDGDPLSFLLLTNPAAMSIDAATGLVTWTPTAAQLGPQVVTVAAVDPDGLGGTQTFTITVIENNQGPTITSQPVQNVPAGTPYRYDVQAGDPDGDPLSFRIDQGPAGLTVDGLGRVTWSPTAANVGVHRVKVTVADNKGASITQEYDLAVNIDAQTPRVNLAISSNPAQPNAPVTFVVTATDNVGVTSLGLTIDGQPVALDPQGRAVLSRPFGQYAIVAGASDAAGNTGLASTNWLVLAPPSSPPTIALTSPTDGQVISSPIDVIGTVTDDNLVGYTLLVAPVSGGPFVEMFRGSDTVTDGKLGRFDPTGLANDDYIVRLEAADLSGTTVSIDTLVSVIGDLKVGNFTVSFTDLSIPVSGIPLTVTRTYDSLTAGRNGALGFGWRLEFRDTNLRTSVPDPTEDELELGLGISPYRDKTHVYITLPGGRREGFTFQPVPAPGFAGTFFGLRVPAFVPDRGVTSALTAASATLVQGSDGAYYEANGLPYNPADALNFGGTFTLTTQDGLAYVIDALTGLLNSVTDVNGNTLTFTDTEIRSSAGPKVVFERDPQGRITAAVDPAGKKVRYQYDVQGDLAAVIDRDNNTTQFQYQAPGRPHFLSEIIDPLGRTGVRNEYDAQGRLVKLFDADGKAVQLTHDPDHFLETVLDPLGNPTTFEYDLFGNVTREIDALGHETARTYDGNNNVLSETDPLGNTTTYTYDGNNNLLTTTDPLGNVTRNTYQTTVPGFFAQIQGARPVSYLAGTTDPLGNTTTYTYDGGNLTATTDALGKTTKYTYDAAGNQTAITDADGKRTAFEYDGRGNLTKQTDALGAVTTYVYDANGNQLSQSTTVSGRVVTTTTEYDASGRPTKVTDAEGHVTRTEYDALGRQSAAIDALGRRTEFVYDDRGQLIETRFADGTKSTTSYDAAGRRIASTDRAGRTTKFVYDAVGRLIETIAPDATPAADADNPRTKTEYDPAGRVIAQIDELGRRTEFEYDKAGRQTVVRDALGHVTTTSYDTAGRRVAVTDALNNTTQFAYDALGRLTQTTFADAATTKSNYDALGRAIAQTDQLGRATHYEYDALGRLTAVVDALNQRTEYTYDEAGNLITQKDANGHETQYEYDRLGRRTATILPLGQRSDTAYDAVGNVAGATDFNRDTITYQYDVNNRLTRKQFPDGTAVTFTYTATGQRAGESDPRRAVGANTSGTSTFTYDARDRLLSRKDPDGRTIAYTYDLAGNRTSVIIPSGTTSYTFDALNRLKTVTDPDSGVTTYTYNARGELTRTDFPNGTFETRQYDPAGHLTVLENRGPSGVISSYTYTLAPNGRRDAVLEDNGRRVDYKYDLLDRLIEEFMDEVASATDRKVRYTYDPVGNRLTRDDTAEGVTTYSYDANDRLLTETLGGATTPYTYDANGNTLSKFTSAVDQALYDWDFENRLIGATVTDSTGTKDLVYKYNADGIRVSSKVDGAETRSLIDSNQPYAQVLEEYTSGSVIVASYVYGNDLVSMDRGGARSIFGVDGLGSTRVLTNSAGVATDRYIYDAFGRTIGKVGSTENIYLFAGEQRDAHVGLDYLRARYLDASTGRFVTRDNYPGNQRVPISLSRYIYGHQNPSLNIDPSGEAVYAALRPLDIDFARQLSRLGRIGAYHQFLAFTDEGIQDRQRWFRVVAELNRPENIPDGVMGLVPPYASNGYITTFSFHPYSVLTNDKQLNAISTILTRGSYVAYNDAIDRLAFFTGGSRHRKAMVVSNYDELQIELYKEAITSRNINNSSPYRSDPSDYGFLFYNCGSWVQYILAKKGVPFPFASENGGVGTACKLRVALPPPAPWSFSIDTAIFDLISSLSFGWAI